MPFGPFHPALEDLPTELPVFPLPGALLLPTGRLPLNIFEPRYLNLVQDALGGGRLFGMIQPREPTAPTDAAQPALYGVGCCGRISSFAETDDGRLVITLTGVARFKVTEELPLRRGYRVAKVDFKPFISDLKPPRRMAVDRPRLMAALESYVKAVNLPMNADLVKDLKPDDLVTSLSMVCPLDVSEKQALLEAVDLSARAEMLTTILEMARFRHEGSDSNTRQ